MEFRIINRIGLICLLLAFLPVVSTCSATLGIPAVAVVDALPHDGANIVWFGVFFNVVFAVVLFVILRRYGAKLWSLPWKWGSIAVLLWIAIDWVLYLFFVFIGLLDKDPDWFLPVVLGFWNPIAELAEKLLSRSDFDIRIRIALTIVLLLLFFLLVGVQKLSERAFSKTSKK